MRVKAVVDKTIMVCVSDVVVGDVLSIRNDESDPIIDCVEYTKTLVRFHYVPRGEQGINRTIWMHTDSCCFIHDFKNERAEFAEV